MSTALESRNALAPTGAIERKLASAWLRERRYFHLRGAASLVPWVIGLFLLDLLLDWFLELSGLARLFLLLSNVALLAWLAHRRWVRYLRRFDAARVAL